MVKSLPVVCILALSSVSWGALPKPGLEAALSKKPLERMASLKSEGPLVYGKLKRVAFDDKQPYQMRWRALMSLALMGQKESVRDLELALKSKDWFMRDAGLQALTKVDENKGKLWARKLLADPALIVRTTAVNMIRRVGDTESEPVLWDELYRKNNYRGKQSLWIRRHIVETLSEFSSKGREMKFAALLDDPDKTLHAPAMKALERLTGKNPGRQSRLFWKNWAKRQ